MSSVHFQLMDLLYCALKRRGKIWIFYVGKANGEQRIRNSECEQNNE